MTKADQNKFTLPLVDFSSFSSNDSNTSETQIITANLIHQTNCEHGFVCLRNSGIQKSTIEKAFASSQQLFDLPLDYKIHHLKQNDPQTSNTGYTPIGKEALNKARASDLKEAFNIRNTSISNGDLEGTPADFHDSSIQIWNELSILTNKYAKCCALALGLPLDYFSKTIDSMDLCTMRILHYPPCKPESVDLDSKCAIRVGEHTDFGAYTFLFIHNIHDASSLGLQVKAIEGGDFNEVKDSERDIGWSDVVFDEEALQLIDDDETSAVIVNTGALMARWTNDIWRATAHRVVVAPEAFSLDRYSIAMFIDPDRDTLCSVHPKFVKDGEEPKYPPVKSIDYLLMKLREVQCVKKEN
jgi:isopenicillin N synthase-like dioxygenase